MALIGTKVPTFSVQAYVNGDIQTISNEDALGKWAIYYFYPADFTFVCPTELADVQDKYEELKGLNTEVYSVSTDSHFVHKAWADATDTIGTLQYPMLADPTHVISRGFQVLVEETGMALRASFIANPEGEIVAYEIHSDGIGRDADELVRKLQAAQFVAEHGDQVCPAKWQPGAETLMPSLDLIGKI